MMFYGNKQPLKVQKLTINVKTGRSIVIKNKVGRQEILYTCGVNSLEARHMSIYPIYNFDRKHILREEISKMEKLLNANSL